MKTLVRTVVAVIASLCVATPAFAYRQGGELPDLKSASGKVVWNGPVALTIGGEVPVGLVDADVLQAARNAIVGWTSPECSKFEASVSDTFSSAPVQGDGMSTIGWVKEGWSDLGVAENAAATTSIQYEKQGDDWRIVEADVFLNAESFSWSLEPKEGFRSLQIVLAHEFGHVLGLLHPCETTASDGVPLCDATYADVLMHPEYDAARSSLGEDDRLGVCFLYPAASCAEHPCGDDEICTDFGCLALCGDGVCGSGESCVEGVCEKASSKCLVPGCECAATKDCAEGLVCVEDVCVDERGRAGDFCQKDGECYGLWCIDGVCPASCNVDDDCGPNGACNPNKGLCSQDGRASLGEDCDSADDCVGGKCVAERTATPFCSRNCGEDLEGTECPSGWECASVSSEKVCVPAKTSGGCGCRVSKVSTSGNEWVLCVFVIGAFFARRFSNRVVTNVGG